ncbi:NlpC/P60 family protein [Seinonella peptonophila]|uniref:NlpC/P60 family protein n=1 Tax=Seinonella peptonophila TaxID=112248 RepID=A0A1M4X903_9BACL|nr:C40 family peptidase [Seinonella peptonophila]SHE89937.1 NlpC/P60 family protein [Seinonella peptonophila]
MKKKIAFFSMLAMLWPVSVFANPIFVNTPSDQQFSAYTVGNESNTDPYYLSGGQSLDSLMTGDQSGLVQSYGQENGNGTFSIPPSSEQTPIVLTENGQPVNMDNPYEDGFQGDSGAPEGSGTKGDQGEQPTNKDKDPKGQDKDPKGQDKDPKGQDKDPKSQDKDPKSQDKDPKTKKENTFSKKDVADLKKNYTNNGKIDYKMGGNKKPTENQQGVLDCSSFVQWAMKKYQGISLPRQTDEQYLNTKGKTVKDPKDLKRGDLVFFKNTYNCSDCRKGITHVGIYIGKGKFIHNSSGKGQATVSNLNNPYYKQHYYGGKTVKKK